MAKKTTAAKEQTKPATLTADGSIDQVRELLFGEQVRRVETRFSQLEQQLEELFGQMEQRLQSASREQTDDVKKLRVELREFRQDIENNAAAAEDEWLTRLKETDKTLRTESKAIQTKLQQSITDLRQDKVGRVQLAELLNNLAVQLTQGED